MWVRLDGEHVPSDVGEGGLESFEGFGVGLATYTLCPECDSL